MTQYCYSSNPVGESSLSSEQVKHLIGILSSQLQHDSGSSQASQQHEHFVSCFHDIYSLSLCSGVISNSSWVLDTGATYHICCSLSLFHSQRNFDSTVTLPDGSTVPITCIGTVFLSHELVLSDVLFVPHSASSSFNQCGYPENAIFSHLFFQYLSYPGFNEGKDD